MDGWTCYHCGSYVPYGVSHYCPVQVYTRRLPQAYTGDPIDYTPYTQEPPEVKIKQWGQMGWECPKCGRCYSPYTSECRYCKPKKKKEGK